jgi:MFS family permease
MTEHKYSVEEPGHSQIANTQEANVVLKMSQIRNRIDCWSVYIGVLFYGLAFYTISTAISQLDFTITSYYGSFDIGPVVTVANGLLGILFVPLLAALSDIYGRGIIFTFGLILAIIGNFIMGFSDSFGSYTGGNIIGGLGDTAKDLMIPIILADFLRPKDRGFGFIINWLPSLLAVGLSIPVITASQDDDKWFWLFKGQAIMYIVTGAPILFALFRLQLRAKRLLPEFNYKASSLLKVDWIGISILTASLGCILIPFSLVVRQDDGWAAPATYAPIIVGGIGLIFFIIWEIKFTKYPLISYGLLCNRAAMIMLFVRASLSFDSNFTWSYMTPYLVLSRDISADEAAQIFLGFRITWYILGFAAAFLLRRYTSYVRSIVWISLAVNAAGMGLALASRHPGSSTAFVVIAEAVIGAGAGVSACAGLVVLQSTVDFSELANISAIDNLVTNIFTTTSTAIVNAIWNSATASNLMKYLPEDLWDQIPDLLADTEKYAKLPEDVRDLWVTALGESQWLMCTISTVLACVCFAVSLGLPAVDLEKCQQILNEDNDTPPNYDDENKQAL